MTYYYNERRSKCVAFRCTPELYADLNHYRLLACSWMTMSDLVQSIIECFLETESAEYRNKLEAKRKARKHHG